jgi:hypothetical protein
VSDENLSEPAARMGRKGGAQRSQKKTAAVGVNIRKAQAKRWPTLLGCNCGAATRTGKWAGKHKGTCPVYKREAEAARRDAKAKAKAAEQGEQ